VQAFVERGRCCVAECVAEGVAIRVAVCDAVRVAVCVAVRVAECDINAGLC